MRKREIRLSRPLFGREEYEAIRDILDSGFLIQGRYVEMFEEGIRKETGSRYVVATSSGTSALHLLFLSIGIGKGDEVIIPDFTFPSVANMVEACGAHPVPVDAELSTMNMNMALIPEKVTERTKAILVTHLFGIPASIEMVDKMVQGRCHIIEDSACSLGSYIKREDGTLLHTGRAGSGGILSFHPRKVITTGDGGAVITDSVEIADKVRSLRNHGIQKECDRKRFVHQGFNYRMTEIQGALGFCQMKRLSWILEKRRNIARIYDDILRGTEGLYLPEVREGHIWNFQSYPLILSEELDREMIMKRMREEGIETSIAGYSIHREPYFARKYDLPDRDFPVSTLLSERAMVLPIHPLMSDGDTERVALTLKSIISNRK